MIIDKPDPEKYEENNDKELKILAFTLLGIYLILIATVIIYNAYTP